MALLDYSSTSVASLEKRSVSVHQALIVGLYVTGTGFCAGKTSQVKHDLGSHRALEI